MGDAIVHIGESSPEFVAFRLYHEVRQAEDPKQLSKKWILDTYAECLNAVRQPENRVAARSARL
jgi:hypothetical protein